MSHRYLLLVPAFAGCVSNPPSSSPRDSAEPDRRPGVALSADEALTSFSPLGAAFSGAAPARGLDGRFDAEGAVLDLNQDRVRVRLAGLGRFEILSSTPVAPRLGACADGSAAPACVRRLEFGHPGVTEWWVAREASFEQGWTVDSPPRGDGPLTVSVAVDGARALVGHRAVRLKGHRGAGIHVSGLRAWDADGVALDAAFEARDAGFLVVVDDTHARYPVTIDPIYTTESWSVSGSGSFAGALSSGRDIDNDGYDDVLVGASSDNGGLGRVYVYAGSASGLATEATQTIEAEGTEGGFGAAVSDAGDVNGDGHPDVIVGTGNDRAYVYLGSSTGLETPAAITLEGSGESFGAAVAGAGDVDADGYDDVIVGAPSHDADNGRAYVFLGSASGTSTTAAFTYAGQYDGSSYWGGPRFGESVSGAGDVNADGYDDVIIGAWGAVEGCGAAYVFHGSATGLSATADATMTGSNWQSQLGHVVSDGGDVNRDGFDDVFVNEPYIIYGSVYWIPGSATGVQTSAAVSFRETARGSFGEALSGAGDVNGDGYDDVIAGDTYWQGTFLVFQGTSTGVSGSGYSRVVDGGSGFGATVSDAGDVNGDGYDDVLVGEPGGTAYMYLGYYDPDEDIDGDGVPASEDCDDADGTIGAATTEVIGTGTDEDCDGIEICYVDADGDGYRPDETATVESANRSCADPGEALSSAPIGDCDDASASVNAGAVEVMGDGIDQDCDLIDECYEDLDGDGYGSEVTQATSSLGCTEPAVSTVGGDCDDAATSINPDIPEVPADGIDQDCDGVDHCYTDADGDGFGDTTASPGSSLDCTTGTDSTVGTDCNDGDANVCPGFKEVLNDGIDQDCDLVDLCYVDADGDNYGTTSRAPGSSLSCADGEGAPVPGDCDDSSAAVHPGATEIVGDGIDEDCNDIELCYTDADDDNYGTAVLVPGSQRSCTEGPGAPVPGDCDDNEDAVHPDAEEGVADGIDQDCDSVDLCYEDADGDEFGATTTRPGSSLDCEAGAGAEVGTDCDDAAASIHPGAAEIPVDGIDQDCDSADLCYTDADGDGFGSTALTPGSSLDCDAGLGAAVATDCDDGDASVNPDATDIPADGIDQDCDSVDAEPPPEDTADSGAAAMEGPEDKDDEAGCACSSTSAGGGLPRALVLLLVLVPGATRRRRSARR